ESELIRVTQRLGTYRLEFQRTRAERSDMEGVVAERREIAQEFEGGRQKLDAEIKSAQEQMVAAQSGRDPTPSSVSEAAAKLAGLEERKRLATSALERIQSLSIEATERVRSLREQIDSAAAEKAQREHENLQIAQRLEALAAQKVEVE